MYNHMFRCIKSLQNIHIEHFFMFQVITPGREDTMRYDRVNGQQKRKSKRGKKDHFQGLAIHSKDT